MRSLNPTRPIRHFDTELFELSFQVPAALGSFVADSAVRLSQPLDADAMAPCKLDDEPRSNIGEAVRDVDHPVIEFAGPNALRERLGVDADPVRHVRGPDNEQVSAVLLRHISPR